MEVKPARNNLYGVTSLDESRLSSIVPKRTFGGGALIGDAAEHLFIFRSVALNKPRHGTIGFYLDDSRLEPLWTSPHYYGLSFLRDGIVACIEPDFSLWADDPLETQLFNTKRKRSVGRQWQEFGLRLVPDLNWATEASFKFAFAGIPTHAPVVACECRTAGGNDSDRRAFLAGLSEGVRQTEPASVLIYGGKENAYWLADRLPAGPTYTLIEAFMTVRGRIRKAEKRQLKDKNQPNLFTGGNEQWVDAAHHQAA